MFILEAHNARLRGWQRINTKLNHNNRNHRGSLGLETPRVDSPFEAFVICHFYHYNQCAFKIRTELLHEKHV
ncbi:hypothetical protein CGT82_18015 [Vibrio cholerae]|nr:hypothetical protein CGT82_18015 [Vibrio cholerae]